MLAMEKTVRWAEEGYSLSSFLTIFDVTGVDVKEIYDAISLLGEIGRTHADLIISNTGTVEDRKYEFNTYIWADIITDLAMNIKLASDGYIDQALRLFRGTLDNFVMALFSVVSWPDYALKNGSTVNPFVQSYLSKVYPGLRELNATEFYVRGSTLVSEGLLEKRLIELANEDAERIIEEIRKSYFLDTNKKNFSEVNKKAGLIMALGDLYLNFLDQQKDDDWKKSMSQMLEPEYLTNVFALDPDLTVHSCEDHLEKLRKQFRQDVPGDYSSEDLEIVIFTTSAEKFPENPKCFVNKCDNRSTEFILKVRPSTRFMMHVLQHGKNRELKKFLDYIVKEYLDGKTDFHKFFSYKLQARLHRFVHADYRDEPDIMEWFSQFFKPMIIIGSATMDFLISERV